MQQGGFCRLAAVVAVTSTCMLSSVAHAQYTFESLGLGALNGQAGWTNFIGGTQVVTPAGLSNTSARALGSTSTDDTASLIDSGHTWITKFTNTEATAILQYDFRFTPGAVAQQVIVGLGHDNNGNGKVSYQDSYNSSPEVNPMLVAFKDTSDALSFAVAVPQNNSGGVQFYPVGLQAAPAGVVAGDWIRLRLLMNLGAGLCGVYAGEYQCQGAGSLYVQDLTAGDTTFSPVTGFQNLLLGNGAFGFSAPAASQWNGVMIDLQGIGAQLDNILVIPEPTTLALIGLGALLWMRRRSP